MLSAGREDPRYTRIPSAIQTLQTARESAVKYLVGICAALVATVAFAAAAQAKEVSYVLQTPGVV